MARYSFIQRTRCPTCHSTNFSVEYECSFAKGPTADFISRYYGINATDLMSGAYQLVRCYDCTLIYQGWIGDNHLLAELYGEWINAANLPTEDAQYQRIMASPLESRDAHEIMVASSYLTIPTECMVTLDYGMGWAMWARIARALGCQSFGTELVADRVAFGKEHHIEPVAIDELGVGQFHFINAEQVFEHLADPRGVAERLVSALKPGGILKISVPRADRVDRLIAKLRMGSSVPSHSEFMPAQPLEHVNSFTQRSLAEFANVLGVTPVRLGVLQRYAFLKWSGSISFARPKNFAKELVRPIYQYLNPHNLYIWLQKRA